MVECWRGAKQASLFAACASVLSAATEEILSTLIPLSFHLQPFRASFVRTEFRVGVAATLLIWIMNARLGIQSAMPRIGYG
jgi:hypothetical protein